MIERIIVDVLRRGLDQVRQDPTLIDALFVDVLDYAPQESAQIKVALAKRAPQAQMGYIREDATMPRYSVTLQGEQEVENALGDYAGMASETLGDPDFGCSTYGAIWEHNYQIMCYAEHPDLVSHLYELAKSILMANRRYFLEKNCQSKILGGMDLSPDAGYLPEHLFCRVMSLRCQREFTMVDRDSRLGRAFAVTGIAAPPASPYSNGDAQTLIDADVPAEEP